MEFSAVNGHNFLSWTNILLVQKDKSQVETIVMVNTRKYPLRGYLLGSGAPGTPGVTPKTYGSTFISDIL